MINVGDIVSVNFHNVQFTLTNKARVEYIPVATGDSWRVLDLATDTIHYISEGCTITKLD